MVMIRILATNDFLGSVSPLPTTHGRRPGGEALRTTVRSLRDVPSVWIDAGDFAQGGPLAPLSDGRLGFAAAGELGIDVAVAGNHEFDWGPGHLSEQAGLLPFPLLCANADAGLPATHLVATSAGPVGVIGLTHADLAALAPGAPPAADRPGLVAALAADLRSAGARAVIAAVHDGADWEPSTGAPLPRPAGFLDRVADWAAEVDAIVAGHTLVRWMGVAGATPVLQPWAFGMEIGVVELEIGGSTRPVARRVDGVRPTPGGRWTGPGAAEADSAAGDVIGRLSTPVAFAPGRDMTLPDAIAAAIRDVAEADLGFVDAGSCAVGQAPLDGVLAFLPAGTITREQLLRIVPWQDPIVVGELDAAELRLMAEAGLRTMWRDAGWSDRPPHPGTGVARLATGRYASALIDGWIGRPVAWEDAGITTRDAFAHHRGR